MPAWMIQLVEHEKTRLSAGAHVDVDLILVVASGDSAGGDEPAGRASEPLGDALRQKVASSDDRSVMRECRRSIGRSSYRPDGLDKELAGQHGPGVDQKRSVLGSRIFATGHLARRLL